MAKQHKKKTAPPPVVKSNVVKGRIGFGPTTTSTGKKMDWIKIADMVINDRCQQPLKQGHAERIASELDINVLGHLTVNVLTHSGKAEVLDGQTRMYALKHAGYENCSVWCDVFYDLPDAEKALKFVALNNKKNPSVFHKFVKAVTGKKPREVEINAIVEKAGCHVSESPQPNSIRATTALGRVFDKQGGAALRQTVETLHQAYPDDRHGLDGVFIESVGLLYGRYNGGLVMSRLIEVLATERRGYTTFLQRARALQEENNKSRVACLAAAIVDSYNKSFGKARNGRLPSWWSQPVA